jgi:serine/threonine protein kinase
LTTVLALARPAFAPRASAAGTPTVKAAVLELAPGTEVGEYRVVRKLGESGMGAVYAGEQPAIGKRVAIKALAPHCTANTELVRRFLDEARAVNHIHHPHIIDIFSFGELPGPHPCFVMEYLDGESLADAVEHERLRPDEILRLLHQICSALAATHRMDSYPFAGSMTTELAAKHVTEPPPPPSRFRSLPPDLEHLILDCLAKDPTLRLACAEVLGDRLEATAAAWPTDIPPPPPPTGAQEHGLLDQNPLRR